MAYGSATKSYVLIVLSALATTTVFAETAPASAERSEQVDLAGRQVRLVDDGGRCLMSVSDGTAMRLDVKWPCQFSKNHQGKMLFENYRSAQIFMVQHSEPSVSQDRRCDTDLQAVRYFKGVTELAPVSRVGACTTRRWDQKVFVWQFDW
jgi:hypothetical protein